MSAVMQALRKSGQLAGDVTTSEFTVDQYFPRSYDPRETPTADGFIASVVIRAETDKIDAAGNLVDAALAAGATRISVQYSSSKLMASRRGALDSAFRLAKADATTLAAAAGGTLGRLLSLMPNGPPPSVMYEFRGDQVLAASMATGRVTPSFSPANLSSNVFVTGRWEFVPGVH